MDNQPSSTPETALSAVTEELQKLKQNLLSSLQDDVERLLAEKNRLADDIQRLQAQKENLQRERQTAQQQLWARQLAQVLANHLSFQVQQQLTTLAAREVARAAANNPPNTTPPTNAPPANENTSRLLASLDATISTTLKALQQDINSYQSGISQQLSRMQSLEQQGEAILQALVNRLEARLEETEAKNMVVNSPPESPPANPEPTQGSSVTTSPPQLIVVESAEEDTEQPVPEEDEYQEIDSTETESLIEEFPVFLRRRVAEPPSSPRDDEQFIQQESSTTNVFPLSSSLTTSAPPILVSTRYLTPLQIGLLLILLSVVASSLYYIVIRIIFNSRSELLWMFEMERLLSPTLGNYLLILMLRMLVVVPVMAILAPILHPQVWADFKNLVYPRGRNRTARAERAKSVLLLSIVSGVFLFLSQLLIYIAIAHISTGMAIALFFIYPIISVLLSWLLFGDRPSLFRVGVLAFIGLGELLVLGGSGSIITGNVWLGTTTAICSGVAFAIYVIFTQLAASKLHPVSFSLINFATVLLLSFLGLMLPLPRNSSIQFNPANWSGLILVGLVLGALTLIGYLVNSFGIRIIGATRAAIVGGICPVLTVILAWLLIQEGLPFWQIFGVLIVSLGVVGLSLERMRNQVSAAQVAR